MAEIFEGDLIRPLGLVTLYFAYAEAELDLLIVQLESSESNLKAHTLGTKLHRAQKLLKQYPHESLHELRVKLKEGKELFERRNTVVHSCIFSGGRMVSSKKNLPVQYTSGAELTKLAEDIFTWKEHINMNRQKHLMPLLSIESQKHI